MILQPCHLGYFKARVNKTVENTLQWNEVDHIV